MISIVVNACKYSPTLVPVSFQAYVGYMFIARQTSVMSFVYELCAKVKYIASRLKHVIAGPGFMSLSRVPDKGGNQILVSLGY